MKKIVVLVSGSGSNLQAIIENCNAKYINAEIICVISNNPDAYGLERAASANINSIVMNNKDYISRDHFDSELIKILPFKFSFWISFEIPRLNNSNSEKSDLFWGFYIIYYIGRI